MASDYKFSANEFAKRVIALIAERTKKPTPEMGAPSSRTVLGQRGATWARR